MVFTWAIESVLLGLISMSFVVDWLMRVQLVLSIATVALMVACGATGFDGYHAVAISYLCSISALLLAAGLRPLDTVASVMILAILAVAELAAMGMVFAASQGSTPLFLHGRGHFALMLVVLLEVAPCIHRDIGMGIALSWIAAHLAPFDTVANAIGVLGGAGLCVYLRWFGKIVASWVAVGVAGLSRCWPI